MIKSRKMERPFGKQERLGRWKRLLGLILPAVCLLSAAPVSGTETKAEKMTETDCTIFLYMCGSNLETEHGLATENIDEILGADIPDSTTVIIETGGAERWWSAEWIAEDMLQRYVVRDGHLELLMEMNDASMGSPDTLKDFLKWGTENYRSERNILVLWDHGGSSADGVCYDEKFGFDCLDRTELAEAFDGAKLPGRFDLICLDTCYMGCLTNAALFSKYARYMTASQTIVPGPGLDYEVLVEEAAESDLTELGKTLCDTFMVKSRETGRTDEAQLAFYDLDAVDTLIREVDLGALIMKKLYERTGDTYLFLAGAESAKVAGSGSGANVIDLMKVVNTLTLMNLTHYRDRIQSSFEKMIPYQVCGAYADLNGVSLYYPLNYNEDQIKAYTEISPLANYSALLEEVYADLPEEMIAFKDPGSIGKDGTFDMEISEESRQYLRGINLRAWKEGDKVPGSYILLGEKEVETYLTDLGRKLSDLSISSTLTGEVYGLDGHPLLLDVSSSFMTRFYSAPVRVNGEDTTYSFTVGRSLLGHQKILYTMLGGLLDENGLPARAAGHLKKGDRIETYAAADEDGKKLTLQEEFTIEDEEALPGPVPLPEGTYRCQYVVTDIIGRTVGSDYCIYEITGQDNERRIDLKEIVKTGDRLMSSK